MHENVLIYVASHGTIALSCFILVLSLCYCFYYKPAVFTHPWALLNIMIWLVVKGLVHIYNIATLLSGHSYLMHLVLLFVNAMASSFAAISIVWLLRGILRSPTINEMRVVNDALAAKLGETLHSQKEHTG